MMSVFRGMHCGRNPTKIEVLVNTVIGRNVHKRRKLAMSIQKKEQKTLLDYLD